MMSQLTLKKITTIDVLVSVPLAITLIAIPNVFASFAGGPGENFYFAVGILLGLWCMEMFLLAGNSKWMQKFATAMIAVDFGWAVSSLLLMAAYASSLEVVGWALFGLNITFPAAFGWLKWQAKITESLEAAPALKPVS